MKTIATVVEGHGEVQALPILLRRLAQEVAGTASVAVPTPFRLPRGQFQRADELERAVAVAARRVPGAGGVLVLADADDDCPVELAADLLARAQSVAAGRRVEVVLAQREYEAWFLASLESLGAHPDVHVAGPFAGYPESIRNAKGRVAQFMPNAKYSETRHQPAFSALMDLEAAAACRSFRKLQSSMERLLDG